MLGWWSTRDVNPWNDCVRACHVRGDAGLHQPVRSRVGETMTALSLLLSVAAFIYLVYAMLRPEKF